ncbi:MAG TPA: aspartate--tRNA ligase [Rectinema sp.]|mgnify:FL=1|jgi:aspartyl-tRNA synthetase|nr:aspartate--tRNA ligase [Rectinema sp.]
MQFEQRTVTCGELRAAQIGKTVVLNGWVHRKRDHGGITFINIRDRYGITQVVVDVDSAQELLDIANELKMEYCVSIRGIVRPRPDTMVNPSMPTGEIEIKAENIQILSRCTSLPFMIDEYTDAKEDMRLTYRYLDLRSSSMQRKIRLRHEAAFAVREFLVGKGFYEIETPTFIRSTPEGARDYLVPSRLYPGKFYALPQSPQLYKQLLMISGFDKYFQLARCYRDEDSRGDRQPEFTQIDIEMSFVTRDDVLSLVEGMMGHLFKKTLGIELPKQFVRLSYDDAMNRFGTDKPDLRFALELVDFVPFVDDHCSFQAFHSAIKEGGAVKALLVPNKADYSRRQLEELDAKTKVYKAHGLAWMKVGQSNRLEGGISKFFSEHSRIIEGLGASPGDLILIVADGKKNIACSALGAVRNQLGKDLGLCDPDVFAFAWIIDFPLFEWNEEENRWEAAHHMFTMPQTQYHETLEADPGSVKGDLYDLVLNGYEVASGSIRIHDPELQKRIFRIVGLSDKEAQEKFGFLLEAFKYGPPPHGGIAPGFDRLVMVMAGETSIKEVIAFPKNSFAISPMDQCPSEVDERQLKELHIRIVD